jgi:hypothetical protein
VCKAGLCSANFAPNPCLSFRLSCTRSPLLQFNIGHQETVSGAQQDLRSSGWDGVLLGGNYVAGGSFTGLHASSPQARSTFAISQMLWGLPGLPGEL